MQQPIRYYITKSGEEPTVRSVKVAREAPAPDLHEEITAQRAAEESTSVRKSGTPREGVKRLVQGAIRKRLPSH